MKGYKISDVKRSRTVGVACKSLSELIEKGKLKLSIPKKDNTKIFLLDGTEVDSEEYFQSLPNQSFFLFKLEEENLLTGADLIYTVLKSINIDILRAGEQVKDFLDDNLKEKVKTLAELVNKQDNNKVQLSSRDEDTDWFVGLETNATTKEAFMFRRSQERIRGYLYKTKSDIKKNELYMNSSELRDVMDKVFTEFSSLLSRDKYFGCFFDRSVDGALCDRQGCFKCFGVWKNNECLYTEGKKHLINPYSSREERIVFSTWNLDHRIERSRTIMPALLDAATRVCEQKESLEVNVSYFYTLLFTKANLRLVHIVCHDKGQHSTAKCDLDKIVTPCSRKRVLPKIREDSMVSCQVK